MEPPHGCGVRFAYAATAVLVRAGSELAAATSHGAGFRVFGFIALALACGAAYANALDAGFVYDDLVNITQRASLRWRELSLSNWLQAVSDGPSTRPIALATFGLQYWLGWDSARHFHLINVVIHFLNALLVWRLGAVLMMRAEEQARARGRPVLGPLAVAAAALVAALVFVAHPIQTQSVTYVVQRMNLLAATSQLAVLLLYVEARRRGRQGPALGLALAALAIWLLGLGSKESAAIVPAVVWLYEWYFERDLSFDFLRQTGVFIAWVGVPSAIALFVLLAMSGYDPLATYPEKDFTPLERLMSQPRVLVFYVSELLWPAPSRLSLLHTFEVSRTPFSPWTTLPAAGIVIAALGASAAAARKHRFASFCALWFFLELAIESTVVPLALAMEHRLYLPLVGPAIGLAYGAALGLRGRLALAAGAAAVLVLVLVAGTHVRNRSWASAEMLWRDVLAKYPDDYVARLNLGFDLGGQGRDHEALEEYLLARELSPGDSRIHTNIGVTLATLGRPLEAIVALELALELDPDNPLAPESLGRALVVTGRAPEAVVLLERAAARHGDAGTWLALGRAQTVAGDYEQARVSLQLARRGAPGRPEPQVALGVVARELGQIDRAIGHFERALALQPTAETHALLGLARWERGEQARAIRDLERAHGLSPDWPRVHDRLGWMLATASDATLRDPSRALELARRALASSSPQDASVLGTLAAALAANGRFDEAADVAARAVTVAREHGRDRLAGSLEQQRDHYAAGRVFVERRESP